MHGLASFVILSIVGISGALAADDPLMKQAQGTFEPIPLKPPAIKDVAATPAMVELGKALYFEPRLSQSHNISCNTCHQIGLGGVDMLPTSIGHKWQKGSRNAPTVLNSVFNAAQFWDGRAADLKEQAGGPIQNPIEMGISHQHAIEMLKGSPATRNCLRRHSQATPTPSRCRMWRPPSQRQGQRQRRFDPGSAGRRCAMYDLSVRGPMPRGIDVLHNPRQTDGL